MSINKILQRIRMIESNNFIINSETLNEIATFDDLTKTVFNLTKYNNGYFKSEKQAQYLLKKLRDADGALFSGIVYNNPYRYWADWDNDGITKLYKIAERTKKETIVFVRRTDSEELTYQKELEKAKEQRNKMYFDEIEKFEKGIERRKSEIEGMEQQILTLDAIYKEPQLSVLKDVYPKQILRLKSEIQNNENEIERLRTFIK
jgi:hypothetical protein